MSVITNFNYSPNQQYLFQRAWALAIGPAKSTPSLQYSSFPVPGQPNKNGQITVQPASPLRVVFDLDKNSTSVADGAKIEVYNMSILNRNQITTGYVINLQAGYNKLVKTIFNGIILRASSKRHGADIVTTFEVQDGGSAISQSVLDKTYPVGTPLYLVLQDCAKAMNLTDFSDPLGIVAGTVTGIPSKKLSGYTAHGSVSDTLNALTDANGLKWNVTNNRLNIYPYNSSYVTTGLLVSPETGLIDVPSKNGQSGVTVFTSLLNADLLPGGYVQLQSENTALNGGYQILKCHYEGDTHDQNWKVVCEAQPNFFPNTPLPSTNNFNFAPGVS